MSRIRSIKPSFFQHDKLSELSPEAHLLAAGLLCHADDEGYFIDNPKLIQAAIFPLRELSVSVPELLRSLHGIGYLEFYDGSDGRKYGKVCKFLEHQKVSHPTESTIRPLCEASRKPPEDSRKPHGSLTPELKGIELNRIEGKGEKPESPPLSFQDLKPSEAARMFLEHDDVCIPVTVFELRDTESVLETIQRQEKIDTFAALELLVSRARQVFKESGKRVSPGWARKVGYAGTGKKKQVPMVNAIDVKLAQLAEARKNESVG